MKPMTATLLAIDRENFLAFEGLSISLEEPTLEPIPSLARGGAGAPDEQRIHMGGTVLFDPKLGRYRMWYVAFPRFTGDLTFGSQMAYAESEDGILWQKPHLGLVNWGGSTQNNLVAGLPPATDSGSVILDDDGLFKAAVMGVSVFRASELADERLRQADEVVPMPAFLGVAVSEDGFSWRMPPATGPVIREKFECGRLLKVGGRYVLNGQQMQPWADCPDIGRVVSFFESEDLVHWRKWPHYYRSESGKECHVGIAPLGRVGETWLGLTGRFHDAPELSDQFYELDLVISRDGVHWRMPAPWRPYLRCGPARSWYAGGLLQSQGLVVRERETRLYVSGNHHSNQPDSVLDAGLVRMPRDRFGFAALKVGWDLWRDASRRGYLRTVWLERGTSSACLSINGENIQGTDALHVSLTDAQGRVLEGFSAQAMVPLASGGLDLRLAWRGQERLPERFCVQVAFTGGVLRTQSPRLYALSLHADGGRG